MIVNKGKRPRISDSQKDRQNADSGNSFHMKHNKQDKMQLICGMRPVMEALDADVQIDKVLIQSNLDGRLSQELRSKLAGRDFPVQYVPVEKLDKMTDSNHQGVIAIVSPIKYHDFVDLLQSLLDAGKAPFILLMDHITDVRNLGAIVRTAECVGADAVVVPDRGSAQISEDAIKTSSGALLRIPVCRASNLKTVANFAHQCGVQICAATEKGSVNYTDVDFSKPTILVMGSEETGISNEMLRLCDVCASLPIKGEVQSLNVSVAAGVFMYEMLRQRSRQ